MSPFPPSLQIGIKLTLEVVTTPRAVRLTSACCDGMWCTALILDDRNAYLWTNGYVPQLDTYIGPETPNPLNITVLRSKNEMPNIKTVLSDIMGLTKINYNSCNFNDGLPVTVRFAKMVGDVLTMGSAKGAERQPFKFYI